MSTAVAAALLSKRILLWLLCNQEEETSMKILQLLESSSRLLAGALPTLGSENSVHSEIQRANWCHEQDQ